jgi:hypothetical protein
MEWNGRLTSTILLVSLIDARAVDKFETIGKKTSKKKTGGEAGANGGARQNGRANGEKNGQNGKRDGAKGDRRVGKDGKFPTPRGEKGDKGARGPKAGRVAAAPVTAAAPAAPVTAAPAPAAKLEPVANPAPIRPGGKTLADLVRGEPTPAPVAQAAPKPAKNGAARQQAKAAPKQNGAAAPAAAVAAGETMNWAKKVAGTPAPAPAPQQAEPAPPQQRPAPAAPQQQPQQQQPQQQQQQQAADDFGFGFDASAQAAAAPRPQQVGTERAQAQDQSALGLQFGNFSTTGGDFGFGGFDSSVANAGAAGWGVQQQQQQQHANKKQPSRNAGVATKLPNADAVTGSSTTSAQEQQAAYPAYFGGMMPNAYANYMMPPAVPMAGGYAGYEGYTQPSQNGEQNGMYADYYKQQAAAAQGASHQPAANAQNGDAKAQQAAASSSQPMQAQAYANMPNAYGHPMYSYPYAMPHQAAYPYAVQSHYPYPPGAGVYPGAQPVNAGGKQGANAPPGYKAQDAQRGAEQNGARRDNGQQQYAEQMQGYYTQYAQYGAYRQQ